MVATHDIRTQTGFGPLRLRYLRLGLLASFGLNGLRLFEPGAPASVKAVRAAMVLFAFVCIVLMQGRPRRDGLSLGRWVGSTFVVATLLIAWLRLPGGWSPTLHLLPLVVVFGSLVGGSSFGAGLAVASFVGTCALFVLAGGPLPPFFWAQLTNLGVNIFVLEVFVHRLSAVLSAGVDELTASAEALDAAQGASALISAALSDRVARAVDTLAEALDEEPRRASEAGSVVARVLAECRSSVPKEVALPDARLAERLQALRLQAMDWTLEVALISCVVLSIRNAWLGFHDNLALTLVLVGVTAGIAALRRVRPRWQPALNVALHVAISLGSAVAIAFWFARAPITPPNLGTWLVASILAFSTSGPALGLAELAVLLAVSLLALRAHPGVPALAFVNLSVAYAIIGWIVWRMPQELLGLLLARHAAAAQKIRERRRLVATLFHDLANPLVVVQLTLPGLAGGAPEPEALDCCRSMVHRMQETLTAAISGRVVPREVEAGVLCDELELLFRERLRAKGLSLRIEGPRAARLRCDESLLRDSVLANLLSNALKFSPAGTEIILTIRAEQGKVSLTIDDRGPGLPEAVRGALVRGAIAPSEEGTGGEPGTGYGLMLAQEYLAAMRGGLELSERAGGGLAAQVWLPAA